MTRLVTALALAFALAALAAPAAGAHALLTATSPERGAALDAAPRDVVLRFNEPVEVAFGSVRVFDVNGRQVERGKPFHPGGDSAAVAVALESGLPEGSYTVTYRVVSADSHPVSGGFVFSLGSGGAPAATVDQLLAGQDSGPVTSTAFAVARAIQFAAITLGLGVLAVAALVWLPAVRDGIWIGEGVSTDDWTAAAGAFARRTRTLLGVAAAVGALAAGAALVFQAATAAGTSAWSAAGAVRQVLETRFGAVWGVGALAWVLVLALATARRAPAPALRPATLGAAGAAPAARDFWLVAVAVPLLALAFLPGLGGHAGVQDPVAVLLAANVVHVLAAGAWIGGIAVLVLALPAATRRLAPPGRTRLLAATLGRFSALALVAVAVLLTGGILQSLLMLSAVDDLWDTAFGRSIVIKSVLVGALLALGALNRRRVIPALRRAARNGEPAGAAGRALRKSLRAEVALGVAALAVTGALAGYSPATAQVQGPFSATASLGPARAELTVEPASPGPNEIHVYLFDRSDGRQYDAPQDVRFEAALPERGIERQKLEATKAGPGHYVVSGAVLSPAGDWRLELVARISDFDELRADFEVPVK